MTHSPIRVLLVDDHQMFREGVVLLLSRFPDIDVVSEQTNGADAIQHAAKNTVDVILIDLSLPGIDGIETIRVLKASGIRAKIIILTMHNDLQSLGRARAERVDGYVLKEQAFEDLVAAIRTVYRGQSYFCPDLGHSTHFVSDQSTTSPTGSRNILTSRETEIVIFIASGMSNKEIASNLDLSIRTVETHCSNIHRKLKVKNSAEVTRYAIRNGLISP